MEVLMLIGVIVFIAVSLSAAASEREKERLRNEQAAADAHIKFVTKREDRRGFAIVSEYGWIRTIANTQEDAEKEMRVLAFKKGANAVVNLRFDSRFERKLAGHSKHGNPYYRTEKSLHWEARAVEVEELNSHKSGLSSKLESRASQTKLGEKIVVDGSNFAFVGGNPRENGETILRRLWLELLKSRYDPVIVFDSNIGWRICGTFLSQSALAAKLGVPEASVTVVESRTRADDSILSYANHTHARILSNDNFSEPEYRAKYQWLSSPDRLCKANRVGSSIHIPSLSLVVDI